jgi:hypothetical protein
VPYVLGGRILVFEIVNDTGWTIISRRAVHARGDDGARVERSRGVRQRGQRGRKGRECQYGLFLEDIYRACLKIRGWTRAQQQAPPPAGWYRGIE